MFFLERPFSFPKELDAALYAVLSKHSGSKLKELWPELAKDLGEKKGMSHYSESRGFVEAYSAYYLPANAPKLALILEEAFLLGLDLLPASTRWLDCGTGPGTSLWGLAWWAKARERNFHFLGVDQSRLFLERAVSYTGALHGFYRNFSADFRSVSGKIHWADLFAQAKPQVVSFQNSFHEFFPDVERKKAAGETLLKLLATETKRDGKMRWLVLIEPGTRENSRQLLECLRHWQDQGLGKLWLPCLSKRPCGALANLKDWCHESAECQFPEWHEALGREAGLKKEAVIFSYALLSVGEGNSSGWPENSNRMVSQLLEQKGQTECYFCSPHGKVRTRVQHSKKTTATEAFQGLRRGDLVTDLELGPKGDVLRINKMSLASPHPSLFPSIPG